MGFKVNGRHADVKDIIIFSGTSVETDDGDTIEVGDRGVGRLDLDVTAKSGTDNPTLTAKIQTSKDGSTWRDVASFTAATATGTERKSFSGLDRYVRASWTISGTDPSFTFKISGDLV